VNDEPIHFQLTNAELANVPPSNGELTNGDCPDCQRSDGNSAYGQRTNSQPPRCRLANFPTADLDRPMNLFHEFAR
jgi:hypothetical protein